MTEKMGPAHKVVVICTIAICAMMTITITAHVTSRGPSSEAESFIQACSWGSYRTRLECARLFMEGGNR